MWNKRNMEQTTTRWLNLHGITADGSGIYGCLLYNIRVYSEQVKIYSEASCPREGIFSIATTAICYWNVGVREQYLTQPHVSASHSSGP